MKVLIPKESEKLALRWLRRILFTGAVLTLGYCGFVLLDAWVFEQRQTTNLERLLRDGRAQRAGTLPAGTYPLSKELPPTAANGLLGRLEIPSVGLSAMVVEGTGRATLRRGAGHIEGTAVPGQPGNIGIAAHRDTYFRPLRKVQVNDIVKLTTLRGEYDYRVVSTRVVSPDEVSVLSPTEHEILTMVSCYPFYFVGPAPDRFIVRAERVAQQGSP